jgi:hypothetical protein
MLDKLFGIAGRIILLLRSMFLAVVRHSFFAYLSGKLLSLIGKPFVLTLHGVRVLPVLYQKHPNQFAISFPMRLVIVTPSWLLQEAFRSVKSDIRLIHKSY